MRPSRRETIPLLAAAAPTAIGVLSAAGKANPTLAQEAKPADYNVSQKIDTRIGTLEFTHDFANGYPTDATIGKRYDERDFQRACQAYLWSIPAVCVVAARRDATTRRQERPDRCDHVPRSATRHPNRQRYDTLLPRVRRSLRRAAGHGDPAARSARRDQ